MFGNPPYGSPVGERICDSVIQRLRHAVCGRVFASALEFENRSEQRKRAQEGVMNFEICFRPLLVHLAHRTARFPYTFELSSCIYHTRS